jgi:ribose transport system permease protein
VTSTQEPTVQEPLSGTGRDRSTTFVGGLMGSSVGRNLGLVVALLILCLVGVATAGQQFASVDNALTILRLAAVIGVVSVGMTFVITGGGIDLSVGAIVALASVWSTTLATQTLARDVHWLLIVLTAVAVGLGCGLVNGLLVAYGRVVPFIATLAMLAAARGLAEIIAQRRTQIVDVPGFTDFFKTSVLGVPLLVIIFVLVAVVGWVVLNRTTFGRRTFAVGGNPEAARLAGVRGDRRVVSMYVTSSLLSAFAGMLVLGRMGVGSASGVGVGWELSAIAAAVIGGVSLAGGQGRIMGIVAGTILLELINNGLTTLQINSDYTNIVLGCVLGLAITADRLRARQLAKRG